MSFTATTAVSPARPFVSASFWPRPSGNGPLRQPMLRIPSPTAGSGTFAHARGRASQAAWTHPASGRGSQERSGPEDTFSRPAGKIETCHLASEDIAYTKPNAPPPSALARRMMRHPPRYGQWNVRPCTRQRLASCMRLTRQAGEEAGSGSGCEGNSHPPVASQRQGGGRRTSPTCGRGRNVQSLRSGHRASQATSRPATTALRPRRDGDDGRRHAPAW